MDALVEVVDFHIGDRVAGHLVRSAFDNVFDDSRGEER